MYHVVHTKPTIAVRVTSDSASDGDDASGYDVRRGHPWRPARNCPQQRQTVDVSVW